MAELLQIELHVLDLQEHGPWVAGCEKCTRLRADNEVGLSAYLVIVYGHFENDHNIVLLGGPRRSAGTDG